MVSGPARSGGLPQDGSGARSPCDRTIIPHDIADMAMFRSTRTSTLNLQVRIGGDMAFLRGVAKAVLKQAETDPKALDREFIDRYTDGFDAYRALCEATDWDEIERQSGLSRDAVLAAARVYGEADRSIISWCLGVTQHDHGVDTIREIVNVLLLHGNLGRAGAGPSPVRGHSNVQGNRICGINHHPPKEFLDPPGLRGRIHAGDERALRARRLQHPERPAPHEAREGDHHAVGLRMRACHGVRTAFGARRRRCPSGGAGAGRQVPCRPHLIRSGLSTWCT